MPKANRDWPKPRFSGVARSEKKNQNLSSISSITGQSKFSVPLCLALKGKAGGYAYEVFPLRTLCAQMANLDEEVFGTDRNFVARSWRVRTASGQPIASRRRGDGKRRVGHDTGKTKNS